MPNLALLLVLLVNTSNFIHCDLSLPLLKNDPFEDTYLKTVLCMDIKALMKIPILDDDTFISQLDKSISNINGELLFPMKSVV